MHLFKKLSIVLVGFCVLAIGQCFFAGHYVVAASATLIKSPDSPDVYLLEDNQKILIPSWESFISAALNSADIQTVSSSELNSKPDISLLKSHDDPKVYVVKGAQKLWIPSAAAFVTMGYKWEDIVILPVAQADIYNTINLAKTADSDKVYLLENGQRQWITAADTLIASGYSWNKIVVINNQELSAYTAGSDIGQISTFDTAGSLAELQLIRQAIVSKGAQWVADKTPISTLSSEEAKKLAGMKPVDPSSHAPTDNWRYLSLSASIPPSFDWRNNYGNYVTSVKYQGSCGSCWAFAGTAGLESATLIANNTTYEKNPIDLSEQTLISCGNIGSCSAGGYDPGLFLMETGLPIESCYTYGASNGNCSNACANWTQNTYKLTRVVPIWDNMNALKNVIFSYGPAFVQLNLFNDLRYYHGGIYQHVFGQSIGGHAVLAVGYNDAEQYFIAKNSWGAGWGENGYFRIAYSEFNGDTQFGRIASLYTAKPQKQLTVIFPSLNDQFIAENGKTTSTVWVYPEELSNQFVTINLLKNGTYQRTIVESVPIGNMAMGYRGDGSYDIQFSCDMPAGNDYQIELTPLNVLGQRLGKSAFSEKFSISRSNPKITIDPNQRTFMLTGSIMTINWEYQAPCHSRKVNIKLFKNNLPYRDIVNNFDMGSCTINGFCSSRAYDWLVPLDIPVGSDYRIEVRDATDTEIFDWSKVYNVFTTLPAIASISPSSAAAGTKVTITGAGFLNAGNNINFSLPTDPSVGYVEEKLCTEITRIEPGAYDISVINGNGTSNAISFTITSGTVALPFFSTLLPIDSINSTSTKPFPPTITSISPSSGPAGTTVTINGTGFTATGNSIKFGNLGTENNSAYRFDSSDGKTIIFTVPSNTNSVCWGSQSNASEGGEWYPKRYIADLTSSGEVITFTLPPRVYYLAGPPPYTTQTVDLKTGTYYISVFNSTGRSKEKIAFTVNSAQ